jgi:hypothetical protein
MLATGLFAQNLEIPGSVEVPAPVDLPVPPETLTAVLEFKNINVFEYDLDLVFMDEDSNEVWFNEISGDISEANLFTIEDSDGFPVYTVNEDNIGKLYKITYLEHVVVGDMSGEVEPIIKDVLAMEEVSQN